MTAREVELSGGAPWGFRMHGGADQNQPLRISRVNPGRKASLGGIREGDIISSINGQSTKGMNNADAHAMLRSAGPMLRLGLNEDREVSPRRRSIGKSSELKRPSQLLTQVQGGRAIPQAPVYATIRPSQSPQSRLSSSNRASLNSLPAALNSTPLVKLVAQNEETFKLHPTNPFYTTLPSNYTSASKLPVPNGRASVASLDRSRLNDSLSYNDYSSDLKSPSYFTQLYDSGPASLPYTYHNDTQNTNGYVPQPSKPNSKENYTSRSHYDDFKNDSINIERNSKNPFESKRNSDPFEKYLRQQSELNGKCDEGHTIPNSFSDSSFHPSEDIIKRSTITEHKTSKLEEVKTIKKIILNGCEDSSSKLELPIHESGLNESHSKSLNTGLSPASVPRDDRVLSTPVLDRNGYFTTFNQDERNGGASKTFESVYEENRSGKASEVVSKPPVKSPSTPTVASVQSPTQKREYS